LDNEIETAREQRAIHLKDYQTVIANQSSAKLLGERKKELKQIERVIKDCLTDRNEKESEFVKLTGIYDQSHHQSTREMLERLVSRIATLSSESKSVKDRLKILIDQIETLEVSRSKVESAREEKLKNERLIDVSDFIREVLRNAGPHITEAHLKSISIEANQLYREITGNPMISLKWDTGYEILIEEGSYERPFASLSGGEQMSAALAIRLALLKELSDIRIAFFDEPTTNMDEERRRNLAEQIRRIKDLNQLFVISHDDAFEGLTDQLIEIGNE
jgi:DNA repair exonuclease SbcCD ATPase subunit